MRLPWTRRKTDDAQQRLEEAQQQLADVQDRWPAVRRAAESMNEHRERNGFAEAIRSAMGVTEP